MKSLEIYSIDDDKGEGSSDPQERVTLTDQGKLQIPDSHIRQLVESIYKKAERAGKHLSAEELFEHLTHYTNGYVKFRETSEQTV